MCKKRNINDRFKTNIAKFLRSKPFKITVLKYVTVSVMHFKTSKTSKKRQGPDPLFTMRNNIFKLIMLFYQIINNPNHKSVFPVKNAQKVFKKSANNEQKWALDYQVMFLERKVNSRTSQSSSWDGIADRKIPNG